MNDVLTLARFPVLDAVPSADHQPFPGISTGHYKIP